MLERRARLRRGALDATQQLVEIVGADVVDEQQQRVDEMDVRTSRFAAIVG